MLCAIGESRRLTGVRGIGLAALLLTYLVWVTGCATAPPTPVPAAEAYLIPGQSAYFGVNVAANRELVSYVAAALGAEADVIVNRIDLLAGSLDLSVSGGAESSMGAGFSGVALGRFPQGATRFALWKDRGFRRSVAETDIDADSDPGRLVYYRQVGGPLEVAVPESGVILVSTESVVDLSRATDAVELGHDGVDGRIVERIRSVSGRGYDGRIPGAGPDIVIELPEPVSVLTGQLGLDLPRFPILRLSLAVTVASVADDTAADDPGRGYALDDPVAVARPVPAARLELTGEFEFSTEAQAALFGRLGRVFILGFVRALGLETANLSDTVEITADGTELRFQGVTLSPEELVALAIRLTGQER